MIPFGAMLAGMALLLAQAGDVPGAGPIVSTTVGVEGRVLYRDMGGVPLRAAPAGDRDPVVVRIADQAQDGDGVLYDLRFIAQYPGRYDLREHLLRPDGAVVSDGVPTLVQVGAVLPATSKGDLYELPAPGPPRLGGYRLAMIVVGAAWAGIPVYLIARRLARRRPPPPLDADRPPTLADHLRPLVERAVAGELATPDRARLELLLLGYWRDRLGLAGLPPIESLRRMREHDEAGELLGALERWLHRPARSERVDIAALLHPYRQTVVAATSAGRGAGA